MKERIVCVVIAMVLAGATLYLADGVHASFSAARPFGDLGSWAQSPGFWYWVPVAAKAVLAVVLGLACLVALLMAWGAETPDSYLNDPHWCGLLFREHPKRRLREWARSMRYFRFVRGSGGGMDDHGDRLAVLLKPDAREELERIRAAMGTPGGVATNVYEGSRGLEFSITDAELPYTVTQAAVDSARSIERFLEPLAGKVIDPPQDDKYCICPKFYPSFWVDKPTRGAAR